MHEPIFFTHAEWRVLPGREEEFIAAWQSLADAFATLPAPPRWGTLLRSEQEPSRFVSFGPWASATAVATMRADPGSRAALERVAALCEAATPGTYRQVAHVELRSPAS